MKLIRVYFNDYDSPTMGYVVVEDNEAEAVLKRLNEMGKGDYIAEVLLTTTPDEMENLVKEMMSE